MKTTFKVDDGSTIEIELKSGADCGPPEGFFDNVPPEVLKQVFENGGGATWGKDGKVTYHAPGDESPESLVGSSLGKISLAMMLHNEALEKYDKISKRCDITMRSFLSAALVNVFVFTPITWFTGIPASAAAIIAAAILIAMAGTFATHRFAWHSYQKKWKEIEPMLEEAEEARVKLDAIVESETATHH